MMEKAYEIISHYPNVEIGEVLINKIKTRADIRLVDHLDKGKDFEQDVYAIANALDNSYEKVKDVYFNTHKVNDDVAGEREVEIFEGIIELKLVSRKEEIEIIIKDFADHDQYSANNAYVKALYRELREIEGREQIEEEDYTPQFIGGSDVPIGGDYE